MTTQEPETAGPFANRHPGGGISRKAPAEAAYVATLAVQARRCLCPCPGGRDFSFPGSSHRVATAPTAPVRRSPMPTPRKVEMLAEIKDRMERASIAISADYRGLTVAQLTELRRALRPAGAEVKIVKNTLAVDGRQRGRPRRDGARSSRGRLPSRLASATPSRPSKPSPSTCARSASPSTIHGGWLEGTRPGPRRRRKPGNAAAEGAAASPTSSASCRARSTTSPA